MKKIQFETSKTARIFIEGDVETSDEVWILLHGYAQLASDMLQNLSFLAMENVALVAPEGLHRFYRRGFYGDVVASWMTREDRLDDIEDYLNYLNELVETLIKPNQKVNVLGFSQGVATACRWIGDGRFRPSNLVLWAGTFPEDIDLNVGIPNLRNTKVYLAYDNEDVFRTEDSWQKQQQFFEANNLSPVLFEYSGGHTVPKEEFQRFLREHINRFPSD